MSSWSWMASQQRINGGNGQVVAAQLDPKSVARLRQLIQGCSVGIISAHSPAVSGLENNHNDFRLREDVKQARMLDSIVFVAQRYTKHWRSHMQDVAERSLLVFTASEKDAGVLKHFLAKHSEKYDQPMFVFKGHDDRVTRIFEIGDGASPRIQNIINAGPWTIERIPEFHSMLVNGKMADIPEYDSMEVIF